MIKLRVNGTHHEVAVQPQQTLLDVLRKEFKLFGARAVCGMGMCGACTVLVDGTPVSGCLTLAELVEGQEIVTVEGLVKNGRLHPIQQAFVDHNAFQCAFCTPGFILMAKALLEENPSPTVEEVKEYLAGNLCRCGSYTQIIDAVLDAAGRLREGQQVGV